MPTTQTAQPDDSQPEAAQRSTYQTVLAGLLDFMYGKGQADIRHQLQQAGPDQIAVTIGHVVFALIGQAMEQAQQRGIHLTAEMLVGVATELIDSLERMALSQGIKLDVKQVEFHALVQVLTDYAGSQPDGSQTQREAQEALQSINPSALQQTHAALQEFGQQAGVDPFGGQQGQPTAAAPPDQAAPESPTGLMGVANA